MKNYSIIKQPVSIIIATLLLVIVPSAIGLLAEYASLPSPADMPLGILLDSLQMRPVTALLFASINAVLINSIIVRYSLAKAKTFLPLTLYFISACPMMLSSLHPSIAIFQFILILSTYCAINSFRRSYQFQNVFIAAFYLGILPLLFSDAIFLLPLLPVTLSIYHRTLREAVTSLFGLLTPWVLASTAWWIAGFGFDYTFSCLAQQLHLIPNPAATTVLISQMPLPNMIFSALFVSICIFATFVIIKNFNTSHNRYQKILAHFLWMSLFAAATLLSGHGIMVTTSVLTISGTVFMTYFFSVFRGWIPLLLYIVLTAMSVWTSIMSIL